MHLLVAQRDLLLQRRQGLPQLVRIGVCLASPCSGFEISEPNAYNLDS